MMEHGFWRHWRRGRRGPLGDERGVAALEFAFAAIILTLLGMGLIDFARGAYTLSSVENLAKEGARWASVNGAKSPSPASATDIENYVRAHAKGLEDGLLNVNTVWDATNDPGQSVEVTVSYNYQSFLLKSVFPDAFTFTGTSTLVISR